MVINWEDLYETQTYEQIIGAINKNHVELYVRLNRLVCTSLVNILTLFQSSNIVVRGLHCHTGDIFSTSAVIYVILVVNTSFRNLKVMQRVIE